MPRLPTFNSMEDMMAFYYPESSLIRKTVDYSETAGSGTHWEPLYGKMAWSWLNMEANLFAMLPKEPWRQTGYRVLTTAANTSGGGVTESTTGGAPTTAAVLTFMQLSVKPKNIAHTFDVTQIADFLGGVDDAIDLLPLYREQVALEHAFCMNLALGNKCEDDAVADPEIESLDRITASYSEVNGNSGISVNECDVYGADVVDRDAGAGSNDAYVNEADGVDRDLTLLLIDTTIQNVWDNGGKPKVIATKTNTLMRWQQLMESERRFMDPVTVVPTFGGVRGPAPGVEGGFMVATYFGIPIIPSQHVDNRDTIGTIMFLDTDFLKLAVAQPTVYSETGKGADFVLRNVFAQKGMYQTLLETRAYRFNCHGKLCDLK